jgi:hypothetical protein
MLLLASNGGAPADPASSAPGDPASERGLPALFSWGDVDGDGRLDLAAVTGEGALRLLANAGEGRFEDVTEQVGLSGIEDAALALWADYDGDGRSDLFVGARAGTSRLLHNEGGVFVDMSAGSGLASQEAVQSAEWLDHDGDGRLDLVLVAAHESELFLRLFRGLEGGFFEQTELRVAGVAAPEPGQAVSAPAVGGVLGALSNPDGSSASDGAPAGSAGKAGPRTPGVRGVVGSASRGSLAPSLPLLASCLTAIRDQANPGMCLKASSSPTLGRLYPITANLFVALGGDVGIGTTSPGAKLDVAGTARMGGFVLPTGAAAGRVLTSDAGGVGTWQPVADLWVDQTGDTMTGTLTLNPGVDQALDVSTGSIYKGGSLFLHTKGGADNTALGEGALTSVTTGSGNTAFGDLALTSDTSGFNNTASGSRALRANTSGARNTAVGVYALASNTIADNNTAVGTEALRFNTGYRNTAAGDNALRSNTTGSRNTASGFGALQNNTTGSNNIALGNYAGSMLTTGSNNIAIGSLGAGGEGATIRIGSASQTRAFVAGIRGVTTANANAIPVLIDSAGQLGTVSSSRRFKEDIRDMGDATERLLDLRPVLFRYKQPQTLPGKREVPPEYGLVAEEVAEVFPDLVVHDEQGQPFTVKYHLLSSMLLNELKKLAERCESQATQQRRALDELESLRREVTRLHELEARLAAVESRIPDGQ